MKIFNRCCCCSLKTGAKFIGYYEAITGGLICILLTVVIIIYLLSPSNEIKELEISALEKGQNFTVISTEVEEVSKAQRALVAFTLIFYLTYFLFFSLLGVLLLYGIYKEKRYLIYLWVQVKVAVLLLSLIPILFRLFLLLFDLDSNLKGDILMGAWDVVLIIAVYSYHEEMEEVPDLPVVVL